MTDSYKGSRSGSKDGDDSGLREELGPKSAESTLALASPIVLMSRWCVHGMQNIYREDVL